MVASNGAGPLPVPFKVLTVDKLMEALHFCLQPSAQLAAQKVAAQMQRENGVQTAVQSFHRSLPWKSLVCDILPLYAARWTFIINPKSKENILRLSDEAAHALIRARTLKASDIRPYVSAR